MISQVYKFTSISFLPFRRKGYLISREPVLPRVSGDKSFWGFNPRTTSWPCVLHVVPRGCIGATRIARVVELCVCVCVERARGVRRNLYSRFGRLSCVLQAWWLCAAMRLCYHTIEHLYVHIPSPHFFLSLFFFFILNPRSRFGDNQSEGDRGLE